MPALTSDIAEFVTSVEVGALPEQCSYGARIGMVDCVGVMIAGAGEPVVRLVTTTIATSTQNEGAPEIPSGRNLAATDAALVNGVAAHALDYDDVGMDGHPSAVLTPAILAEGWSLDVSGSDAIAAYVAGYEVWALLQEIEPGHLHERGFHPTAIWGAFAAAAACARLNRLTVEQTRNAIAIVASLAAGVVANFGTMCQHAAWPSQVSPARPTRSNIRPVSCAPTRLPEPRRLTAAIGNWAANGDCQNTASTSSATRCAMRPTARSMPCSTLFTIAISRPMRSARSMYASATPRA